MSLADFSIRRPVFAWMLMSALIVFGLISFFRLGISQLPNVDFPIVSVSVPWEGAAPEVVEAEIADPLEQSLVAVEGVREITSTVRQGQVTLALEFDLSRNIDAAVQEVQSAISRVRLPLEVDPPTIRKTNPDDSPIIWVGVSSTTRSLRDLISIVDLTIRDQFQTIPGVGEVLLGGFTDRNLRVWVDHKKLDERELTILDVRDALQRGHIETAAGVIENDRQELNLRVMGEGFSTDAIAAIEIATRGGRPIYNSKIRLGDVAVIEDGLADIRRLSRANGVPAVGLGIKKLRDGNAVEIGERVKQKLEELKKSVPDDMELGINFDTTVFVKESVEESEFTLILSAIVTGVVCWMFLGSLRPTFNILLSIPTSIIGAFTVIYFMGFTLNLFTILGLALAIGIVVDDAIMVLENIYRHKAMGKDAITASRDGANEITFAALAATVAVIAIFLPVAFMEGVIGRFFFEFGVTIVAAVALSLVEALTLTPVRSSQFMSDAETEGRLPRFITRCFERLARVYRFFLDWSLTLRWAVILVAVGLFAGSLSLVGTLRKEFIPPQDQGTFQVRIEAPIGSSLAKTSEFVEKVEAFFMALPDVRRVYATVGGFGGSDVGSGSMFISLHDLSTGRRSQGEIMQLAREELKKMGGFKAFVQDLSTRGFTAQRGFPVDFNIRGASWEELQKHSAEIMTRLEETGLVVDMNTDYRLGQPEVRVTPNRAEALRRGVPIEAIAETVAAAIGGMRQGKFTHDGRRYDVRLRLKADERLSPDQILRLNLRNIHGELVPLRDVVTIETVPTLQTITRRNRERSISMYGNVAPGRSQAEALAVAERISHEVLSEGYRFVLSGGARTFQESFESLIFVLWLGIVVAYMVLAAQFNSYLHPLSVLVSLPFSVTGALAALYLCNQSINLYSLIGVVLLMGIVKKNAILLVEFANHVRDTEGASPREALLTAAPVRLRPILMTSLATIAAALPPALALGPGAESRIPMSITIVGGVIVSTVFTLFVVPCVYLVFSRLERRRPPVKHAGGDGQVPPRPGAEEGHHRLRVVSSTPV